MALAPVGWEWTKLSFTEWNFGGGDQISGALAVADVLGIFGRYRVDLATYWPLKSDERFAYAGLRAYRNYDGAGASFGDTSIAAASSEIATATVYASIDSQDPARTVIVLINKATTMKTVGIRISQSVYYKTAKVFTLTSAQANLVGAPELSVVADNAFHYAMPAQSVSCPQSRPG